MGGTPLDDRAGQGFALDPTSGPTSPAAWAPSSNRNPGLELAAGVSFLWGTGFHAGEDATKGRLEWRDLNESGDARHRRDHRDPGSRGDALGRPSSAGRSTSTLHGGVRTPLGWTRVFVEATVASNLDRAMFVADPVVSGARRPRGLRLRRASPRSCSTGACSASAYDYYDPNSDLLDQRLGLSIPADASIHTLSPLVGARIPDTLAPGFRARLVFQYDVILDALGRDARGVPPTCGTISHAAAPGRVPMRAALRPLALASLAGCTGEVQPLGLGEPIRVRGATLRRSALPGVADATEGPRVTAIETFGGVWQQGQLGIGPSRGACPTTPSRWASRSPGSAAGGGSSRSARPIPPTPASGDGRRSQTSAAAFRRALHRMRVVAIDEAGAGGAWSESSSASSTRGCPTRSTRAMPVFAPPDAVIVVEWDEHVDLDLVVVTPEGKTVDERHPTTLLDPPDGEDARAILRMANVGRARRRLARGVPARRAQLGVAHVPRADPRPGHVPGLREPLRRVRPRERALHGDDLPARADRRRRVPPRAGRADHRGRPRAVGERRRRAGRSTSPP